MLKHVGKMTVAAHRGDCYNYYENTMTAFKKAIQEGVDMIETDVHLTKDGTLVLIHDNTVGRTTDGEGEIANMMAEELFKLNAGDVKLHGFYPYSIMQNVTLNPDKHLYCACIFDDKNKEYYDHLIKKTLSHGLVRELRKKTDLIFVHSMVRNWLLQTIRQMLYIN